MILCEGYTDVLALHQAGVAQRGRDHGHLADRRAGRRARARRQGARALSRRRQRRSAGDGAGGEGLRRLRARAARRAAAGRRRPGRADPARGRRGAARAGRGLGAVRRLPGGARARWRRPRPAPRARIARSRSCGRCSRRCRRACCATSWCARRPRALDRAGGAARDAARQGAEPDTARRASSIVGDVEQLLATEHAGLGAARRPVLSRGPQV